MESIKEKDRVKVIRKEKDSSYEAGWEGIVICSKFGRSTCEVLFDNGEEHTCFKKNLQLITKTNNMNKVKIAVSFENDSEKLAYLRYCESIGKVWRITRDIPTRHFPHSGAIAFDAYDGDKQNEIGHASPNHYVIEGYTVVPFKLFAALKGIEYKPEVSVKLNDQHTATILDGKVKVGCQEFDFERIEELYKAIQDAKN